MNTAHWDRVKALLADLAELSDADQERELARLEEAGDEAAAEVRELLMAGRAVSSTSFLEPPTLSDFGKEAELELHGSTFADYELLEELGRGASGVVYRAHQRSLNREVALKLLRPGVGEFDALQRRFLREARAAAQLTHPNIVSVFAVGTESGVSYMAMELAPAGTLADAMKAGPMPPREAAAIIEQVARGLVAAHEAEVIHRDIKPNNILRAADGRPLLADFGLARDLRAVDVSTQLGMAGTPRYMAPELLEAESLDEVHPLADVYSLGVVLFELLTGTVAFDAETLPSLFQQIRTMDPLLDKQRASRLPRALQAVCARAMAKSSGSRYESALAFADDLKRYLDGEDVLARLDPRWVRWVRLHSRRNTGRAAALVAIAFTAWLVNALQPEPPIAEGSVIVRGVLDEDWELHAQVVERESLRRFVLAESETISVELRREGEVVLASHPYRITAVGPEGFVEWDRFPGEELVLPTDLESLQSRYQESMTPRFRFEGDEKQVGFELEFKMVTQGDYLKFLLAQAAQTTDRAEWQKLLPIHPTLSWRPSFLQQPMLGVRPWAARAYAEWKGMRLPTFTEWEYAAASLRAEAGDPFSVEVLSGFESDWASRYANSRGADAVHQSLRSAAEFRALWGGELAWVILRTGLKEFTSSLDAGATGDHVFASLAWHDRASYHADGVIVTHPLLPPDRERGANDAGFRCARSLAPAIPIDS